MGQLEKCWVCKKAGYSFCIGHSIQHEKPESQNYQQPKHTPTRIKKPLRPSNMGKSVNAGKAIAGGIDGDVEKSLKTYKDHAIKVKKGVRSSLKRRNMPEKHYKRLASSLGLTRDSNLECAANFKGRVIFQKMLVKEFKKQVLLKDKQHRLDYYFVTFCDDRFVTLERSPVADLHALKEKVRNAFRNEPSFNYIAFLDITAMTDFPRNSMGNSVFFEIHAIAWKILEKGEKRRQIFSGTQLRSFKSIITDKPVYVSPRKKHPTPLRALAYTSKAPYWGKRFVTSHNKKRGYHLKMRDVPLPPTMRILSIARMLSPFLIDEFIISKGEGSYIVNNAINELRRKNPCPPKRKPDERRKIRGRSRKSWRAAQTARVKYDYKPPQIRISRIDPKMHKHISAEVEPWLEGATTRKIAERSHKENLPKKL